MKAKIIKNDGYALEMVLEIKGIQYHVMDNISPPGSKIEQGKIVDIEFSVYSKDALFWDDMFSGNIDRRKCIDHIEGWSYNAYGEILQINPVIVDCGILMIEDQIHTNDVSCIGEYVKLIITRLGAHLKQ